jgi:type II secretory ATPase GspE/PulE/Tfp pilus assembly ATPase PilB-like protein
MPPKQKTVSEIIQALIEESCMVNASDIHLLPQADDLFCDHV